MAKHIESQGYVVKQTHTYDDRQAFWGATYHVSPATSGQNHDPHRVIAGVQRVPNVARVWPDYQRVPLAHGNHGLARRRHAKQPVPLHNTKPANGTKTPPTGNADDFPPHVITGVAQQHALGRLGKGVTICTGKRARVPHPGLNTQLTISTFAVDTGVDYSTPSLNAGRAAGVPCIGPECQVLGGRDFSEALLGRVKQDSAELIIHNLPHSHGSVRWGDAQGRPSQLQGRSAPRQLVLARHTHGRNHHCQRHRARLRRCRA